MVEAGNDERAAPAAPLAEAVRRFAGLASWGSLQLGPPPCDEPEPWLPLESLEEPIVAHELALRLGEDPNFAGDPLRVLGNYTFRDATWMPLVFAGYLFAAEQRIPVLRGNAMVRRFEWLQHWRLREALLLVAPDDPLAGAPGVTTLAMGQPLADALFAELDAAFAPVIAAFRSRRFVAPGNAWGSVLDSLLEGFLLAGKERDDADWAWDQWAGVIAGRSLPVRRRPRRQLIDVDGTVHEVAIRAGCCLWYTTKRAKNEPEQNYCTSCYLETDERRAEFTVAYQRSVAAGEAQEH